MARPSFFLTQALVFLVLAFGTSCDLVNQASKLGNLVNCEYKVDNVSNLELAGVSIQGKSSLAQIGVAEGAKIASTFLGGQLPLNMNVNLGVKNTASSPAGFTAVQFIVALDGQEINRGTINNNFTVSANSSSTLPISTSVDLRKAFSGRSKDALINLALNLAGHSSKPTMVGLRIKPSFLINGQTFEWPNYINVDTEFKAGKL